MANETATFKNCKVRAVGRAAIYVANDAWAAAVWFPDSQIHDDSELYMKSKVGDMGTLVVTAWIAEQKGLVKA